MAEISDFSEDELLAELRNRNAKTAQSFVTETILDKLKENGIEVHCPDCLSIAYKVYNKTPNGTIRYKCLECGKTFSATKNTIFEGTDLSWKEMVELILSLLQNSTYQAIATNLDKKKNVIWLLALKIYDVIEKFETPKLSGTIQIDETYVRENQKGSHNLVSLIDENHERKRRKRYIASVAGIKGSEFINIVGMVDDKGIAYAKCVSYGVLSKKYLKEFEEHMENVNYLCSDDLDVYRKWCKDKGWKHYIEPSGYRKERLARGYVLTDDINKTLNKDERELSNKIAREMYEEGVYCRIENSGEKYSYDDFNTIHYKFKLGLNSVNSLHSDIKDMLYAENSGVKDAYLPIYLAWLIYTHNYKKQKNITVFSKKDAEQILIDICKYTIENNYSVTREDLKNRKLDIPKTSHEDTVKYENAIKKAREVIVVAETDMFGLTKKFEGDIPYVFNKYKFFNSLRAKRLNEICKFYNVNEKYKKDKVKALCSRQDAQEIIFNEVLYANFKTVEEYSEFIKRKPQKRKRGRPRKQKDEV